MTMREITYRYSEDGFIGRGIFFSEEEWNAFQEESAEAGCPVVPIGCQIFTPEEFWKHAQEVGYEEAYAVEVMAIATLGYEECRKYNNVYYLSKILKEKGII